MVHTHIFSCSDLLTHAKWLNGILGPPTAKQGTSPKNANKRPPWSVASSFRAEMRRSLCKHLTFADLESQQVYLSILRCPFSKQWKTEVYLCIIDKLSSACLQQEIYCAQTLRKSSLFHRPRIHGHGHPHATLTRSLLGPCEYRFQCNPRRSATSSLEASTSTGPPLSRIQLGSVMPLC